jgi:hypothetical protein
MYTNKKYINVTGCLNKILHLLFFGLICDCNSVSVSLSEELERVN